MSAYLLGFSLEHAEWSCCRRNRSDVSPEIWKGCLYGFKLGCILKSLYLNIFVFLSFRWSPGLLVPLLQELWRLTAYFLEMCPKTPPPPNLAKSSNSMYIVQIWWYNNRQTLKLCFCFHLKCMLVQPSPSTAEVRKLCVPN